MKSPKFNITSAPIVAKPRKLKCLWTIEAADDLRALYRRDYSDWIEKVSKPGYELDDADKKTLKEVFLRYPGIAVEELEGCSIPPEIAKLRVSSEEDDQTG